MVKEGLDFISDNFVFSKDCYESVQSNKKGVLRTVKGPVAEWDNLNRNTRKYSERLWDRVLDSSYVLEQKENKTLYGEANHPENRFEVDFSRVSHNIVNMYKVPETKQVFAEIDILDTPLGNVLNVLYEYGSIIGYSSRAGGVLHKRKDYVEVDEDSYHFVTFDAVPYPSVASARPLNEGVSVDADDVSVDISEEAHSRLLQIISESGKKDKEVLKDFIYNLRGYNLDKELSVLEGFNPEDLDSSKESTLKDTTLCLLKDSYRQIRSLRSEKSILDSKVDEALRVSDDYKCKLEASQKKLGTVLENREDLESLKSLQGVLEFKLKEMSLENSKLLNTIKEYEDSIEDMELKILELRVLQEEVKKSDFNLKLKEGKIEKLQESMSSIAKDKEILLEEVNTLKDYSEYPEVIGELGNTVGELTSLRESFNLCVDEIDTLKSEKLDIEEMLLESRRTMNKTLDENVDLEEVVGSYKKDLKTSKNNIQTLNENITGLKESLSLTENKVLSYKESLLKVVCSQYGVTPSSLNISLNEEFSLDDIHVLCESVSTSDRGIEILSVKDFKSDTNPTKSRLDGMFTSSRRGNLK